MDFLFFIVGSLGSLISLYSLICLVRIFITWVPSIAHSTFGRLLAQICDPWLGLFRKFNITKRMGIDVSPIIAIGVLALVSSVFSEIARVQSFSPGIILAMTLGMIWSIVSSLLTFFNIIVIVRLIAELFKKNTGLVWQNIDRLLSPIMQKVVGIFSKNRFLQYKISLAILLACGLATQLLLRYIIGLFLAFLV